MSVPPDRRPDGRPVWLFVGLPAPVASAARVESLAYADLAGRLAQADPPSVIVLPLIGPGFDAVEACHRLVALGFEGEVVVRAPALPDRRLIQRELSQAGRRLKITLSGPES